MARATTAPSALSDPLDGLPGIDTSVGRSRTAGNDRLYLRLLLKFRDSQRGLVSDALADCADRQAAARRMHDLSGIAGTLGASTLARAASDLETALRDGVTGARITALADAVSRAHHQVVVGLETLQQHVSG